jgi:two-component system, NtrC family, sensor kinase
MVVGTLVVAQFATAYLVHNLIRDYILQQRLATVDILTASIVHDITYTGTEDLGGTGSMVVAKYMTYYRVITGMSLYGADGGVVATSDGAALGTPATDPEVIAALTKAIPSLHVSRPDLSNFGIRSVFPIQRGSKIVGAVCIDVSMQDINAILAKSDAHLVAIMAIGLAVVVVALFFLFRVSILLRLRRLMEMTRRLTLGNYDHQVEDSHGDEIGELMRAFNHMATEMRVSQNKIAEHNRDLEGRVIQATAELQQAYEDLKDAQGQLVLNEKMASLGVLIAGVAHEINTPVGAIINVSRTLASHLVAMPEHMRAFKLDAEIPIERMIAFLNVLASSATETRASATFRQQREIEKVLKAHGVPDWQRRATVLCRFNFIDPDLILDFVDCVRNDALFGVAESYAGVAQAGMISRTSSQKISEIVGALKCYSRSDRGQVAPLQVNDSIATALVLLRNQLKHDVDVGTEYDSDLPLVACSSDIHQVWTNLLSNACDAIAANEPESRGAILVRTMREGAHVVVQIQDNGGGIPAENMARIFDPFFTTKDIGKGTGLGLSIVSGIVSRNGGTIHVESCPGNTTFEIRLPIEGKGSVLPPLPEEETAHHATDSRAA